MTSGPPFENDPDTEPFRRVGSRERKRAAVALIALAAAALVLLAVILYAFGSSGGSHFGPTSQAGPTGPAVTVTGGPVQSSQSSTTKPKPPPSSTTASTSAQPGPASCPTSAPCTVPNDIGNAVQALNDYRTAHGQKAVTGSVTSAAKTCALSNGNDCPSSFFWEPVGRDGTEVIDKIAASSKGVGWLLDKSMTAVEVGWAYIPSSHSYECAMISKH